MIRTPFIFGAALVAMPFFATAEVALDFPAGAKQSHEAFLASESVTLATGPFQAGQVRSVSVIGSVQTDVWTFQHQDLSTLALITPLRDQLEAAGYNIVYACATKTCGGFDFRFSIDVVDEPTMHVDLGDFRYLVAKSPNTKEYTGLLVSVSPGKGYIQVTTVGEAGDLPPVFTASSKQTGTATAGEDTLATRLENNGASVLEGLEFLQGSSDLSGSPAETLQELAAFLTANPKSTVVLVGHTDASGSLERNIELSQERAASVMKRLVETYGVNEDQISSTGVGYLAPRTTNKTKAGRLTNRRVEVVLTSGQ